MANVNWNQVYQPSDNLILQGNPALQELQSGIAQQRKQQALDNKDYAAQVAKLNFGGAKDADLDYLHKQYGGILDTFSQLRANNSPRSRAELGQKLQQQQNEFLYSIEKSKQANKQDMELANLPLHPNANLEDGATDRILGLTKISTFDPNRSKTYEETVGNLFAPKPLDVRKETFDIFKDLTNKTTNTDIKKDPMTGMLVNEKRVESAVDKNAYTSGVLSRLRDPSVFRSYQRQVGGNTPEETARKVADETYETYKSTLSPDVTTGQPFETPAQREARSLATRKQFALWKEANIGDGNSGVATPVQQRIPYLNGKAIVDVPDYVPLSIPKKNFAGSPAYNLTDGKRVDGLESSGDYSVIGVGSFPFIKEGYPGAGNLAQPNTVKNSPKAVEYKPMVHINNGDKDMPEDFIIDFSRLPENIKNSKSVKSAIGGVGKGAQPMQQKVKTVASQSDYNAVPKGAQYMAPDGKLYIKK